MHDRVDAVSIAAGSSSGRWRAAWMAALMAALRTALPTALLLAASPALQAAPMGWVLNTNQTIDLVDLASNADAPASTTTFFSSGLAVTPGGALLTVDPLGNLWNVTGPPIPVGATGRTQIGDLDWAIGGLWGYSNASQELFFYSTGAAAVTYAQSIVLPPGLTVTGVAHQPSTGDVYLSAAQGLNNDSLWRVPASAASALLVGAMAHGDSFSDIADIDFDASGTLYAVTWFHRWVYTVSTSTAATSFISAGPHRDSTGLALLPVPEPASAALLLIGLAALLAGPVRRGQQGHG